MPLKFDILNETFECPVCGHLNHISAKECEKCKTLFPDKKPLGGNMALNVEVKEQKKNVRQIIRRLPEKYRKEMKAKSREEVIREFQMVPGITKEIAEKLYDVSGIHSLSDLLYSMLTNQQVKAPERTAIVYEEFIRIKKMGGKEITCPFCKTRLDTSMEKCPVCDASLSSEILRIDYEAVANNLTNFVNEIIHELEGEEREGEKEKKEVVESAEKKEEIRAGQGVQENIKGKPQETEKINLTLDELEEIEKELPEKKPVFEEVEKIVEEEIKLDIDEIETGDKEEPKRKSLDAILGDIIEDVKKEEKEKPLISEEKIKEYRKRIEDWKADGYDVTEIEKILKEKPEQFDELSKKIIIEQFRKRRAAVVKKQVKK
ncbi:MAG: hypothetical protein ACP5LE_01155 [Thermoplasmata archaeon]